ncbi:hypothetical protein OF122_13070 [Pelagibacterium flavum]|uniref:Uncharacterized protein n=1 Tax=Pelagibacterium flavum TaxID=2984530 RepID=A0ABY6IK69_9HYPH|nr:hypothetical protein [Pelagibacterium sp. YIM 151497]UYQ70990.1 hypothetical protein OF122_13070 [Pelagibacterium sp. YIM 151497]
MMIRSILKAFRRPQPRVSIDLDVFNTEGRRAAYVMIGCSLFLGRPANGGPGEAA